MPGESRYRRLVVLVTVLRDVLGFDAEQIADALWLAGSLPSEGFPASAAADGTRPVHESPQPEHDRERHADLLPKTRHGPRFGPGSWPNVVLGEVAVPAGTPLPSTLPLQRALRPFQGYRPRRHTTRIELDEAATAECSARVAVVVPRIREYPRREAELQLLMDDSGAMAVWEPMLRQLRDISERVGAFRRVTVNFLSTDGGGSRVYASWSRTGRLRPAEELFDPTGRRVSLLISDCMGPLWEGEALRLLLQQWLEYSPLALVQPLPQRLWSRTALSIEPGRMRRRSGHYQALEFQPLLPGAAAGPSGASALPVLSPEPSALGAWARLASGSRGIVLGCAGAWLNIESGHGGQETDGDAVRSAEALLRRFENHASPGARRLAMYLSASALTLPVILLIQRAMLPDSGPEVLAEVLNSGLLQSRQPARPAADDDIWFEFAPGVRELLLSRLTANEAALVLKHCSLYIERAFGQGARNLPAVVSAHLSGSFREPEGGSGAVPEPFARVSESVLRRFGSTFARAEPRGSGLARLERYERGGAALDLLEAVELLRAGGPDARLPLVRALAGAWRAWHDPAYLNEAEQAAQQVLEAADLPPERREALVAVLADVLLERARVHYQANALHPAMVDLLRAEELRRRSLDESGRADVQTADAGVGLAEVLRLQFRIEERLAAAAGSEPRDDRRHRVRLLENAEVQLNGLIPRWSASELPAELPLTLGRVLLDQVRAADTAAESGPGAGHAAAQRLTTALGAVSALRTAISLLEQVEPPNSVVLLEALLDLADALTRQGRLVSTDAHIVDEAEEVLERVAAFSQEGGDGAMGSLARYKLAELQLARYAQLGEFERLLRADAALRQALELLPVEASARPELLATLGRLLVEKVTRTGEPEKIDEAVKVLREAVSISSVYDPERPARQLQFARALRTRFHMYSRLADLYEAEWSLAQTERQQAEPAVRAQIDLELGDVRTQLAQRTEAAEQWSGASLAYRRAAETAEHTGLPLLAARAHSRHGGVLEQIAGPDRALVAYRKARARWAEADMRDAPEALAVQQRIHELAQRGETR